MVFFFCFFPFLLGSKRQFVSSTYHWSWKFTPSITEISEHQEAKDQMVCVSGLEIIDSQRLILWALALHKTPSNESWPRRRWNTNLDIPGTSYFLPWFSRSVSGLGSRPNPILPERSRAKWSFWRGKRDACFLSDLSAEDIAQPWPSMMYLFPRKPNKESY